MRCATRSALRPSNAVSVRCACVERAFSGFPTPAVVAFSVARRRQARRHNKQPQAKECRLARESRKKQKAKKKGLQRLPKETSNTTATALSPRRLSDFEMGSPTARCLSVCHGAFCFHLCFASRFLFRSRALFWAHLLLCFALLSVVSVCR